MLRRVFRTEDSLVFAGLPCGVYSESIQQMTQDAFLALFTATHLTVGFSFIHSIVQQLLLLAMLEIVSRGCGYV